jgi:hypothetical protein
MNSISSKREFMNNKEDMKEVLRNTIDQKGLSGKIHLPFL